MFRLLRWSYALTLPVSVALLGGSLLQGCAAVTHASDYSTLECVSNADCPGDNRICRKSDGVCVNLLTAECTSVIGDYKNEDAVLLGATLALTGTNASVGIPEKNAIDLALLDFRTAANGLPPLPGSANRRPLAIVVCDDAATTEVAKRSASHLVKTLRVPAIVGPTWSGVAVTLLTEITLPAETLVLATGTTSPDLTNLEKKGLFYRTIVSMVGETRAMSNLVADVEKRVRVALPQEPNIRVALLHKGDSFGKGSAQVMLNSLSFNGKKVLEAPDAETFFQQNYGDSGNPTASPLQYPETVAKVLEKRPHIIIPLGTGEIFANLIGPVETQWDALGLTYRPYWVLSHSQFTKATTDFIVQNDPPGRRLRQRMVGATPGSEDANYQQFKLSYPTVARDGTDPNSFGASNTYDAVYVAALAISSLGGTPISGRSLASALTKLTNKGGQRINVGPQDLNQGLSLITSGQSIDLQGVSGPLDFDLATGDVNQEVQVWCVPLGPDGNPQSPKTSGYRFGLDGVGAGTFDSVTTSCAW